METLKRRIKGLLKRRRDYGRIDGGVCFWLGCIIGCLLVRQWAWAVIVLMVPVVLFAGMCILGILAAHGASKIYEREGGMDDYQ